MMAAEHPTAMPNTVRGCGEARTKGGLYLECGLSVGGAPLEHFLVDPPHLVDPKADRIRALGVELIDGPDGIVHVLDWVGAEHYPYATDFLEEARRKGVSRKISPHTELHRLTPGKSQLFIVHARGYVENWRDYSVYEHDRAGELPWRHCQRYARTNGQDTSHIMMPSTSCSRYLWQAFENVDAGDGAWPLRRFTDFEYRIFPPTKALTPQWRPAIVARVPITNFTVIRDDDGSHQATVERVRRAAPGYYVATADA